MANVYDKWDKEINTEELAKEVEEAAKNNKGGTYKPLPFGEYVVAIRNMELKASSKGDPMVAIQFKVLEGDFEDKSEYMNQIIPQAFQIHIVNELLRKMVSEMEDAPVIEFKTYSQYGNLIMDIFEEVADNFEYTLEIKKGSKNKKTNEFYRTYAIKEVFDVE